MIYDELNVMKLNKYYEEITDTHTHMNARVYTAYNSHGNNLNGTHTHIA